MRLVGQVVQVSVETVKIVKGLPEAFVSLVERQCATVAATSLKIREAADHFVADFTSKELELACPMVSHGHFRLQPRLGPSL